MPQPLALLQSMPTAPEFYATYWNKRPFVVRAAIPEHVIGGLIDADELAGLAMEDGPQSRMVVTTGNQDQWSCQFGPFSEREFSDAGNSNWSLLVQNVEQFHPETSALLPYFNFAPRWMMDDIMVSFSAPGGSVGPHLDSYHVFLVQGQGKRRWNISRDIIRDEIHVDNDELKILANGFDGDEIEMVCGDVLYVPPKFGHEGTTLEPALTFSVGFLGPKMSDLFSAYGQYLSEREGLDQRYVGDGLAEDSIGFSISGAAVGQLRNRLGEFLQAKDFTQWLVAFFTESSHEDFGNFVEREVPLAAKKFTTKLQNGARLIKPQYVKFAITASDSGGFCLGFDGQSFSFDESLFPVIQKLMQEQTVCSKANPEIMDNPACLEFLRQLYNHQALEIADPAN